VKSRKFIQTAILIQRNHIQSSLSRIDTTDAGREQVNAGQVSPEYILRSDITRDVTEYKIKGYWYFSKYRLLLFHEQ
jgi:hypothetical protein